MVDRVTVRRSGIHRLILTQLRPVSNIVQEYTAAYRPVMSLSPLSRDWSKARTDAGMETNSRDDMHAGELETSLLLHVARHLVHPGNETPTGQRAAHTCSPLA